MVEQQEAIAPFFHPSVFILCSILCVIFWIKWITSTGSKIQPPSPIKLPVLGNLHQLGSLPHYSLRSLAKKHGPLMLLHLGSVPTLIVSSADAAQLIMRTHDTIFSDRPQNKIGKKLLYNYKEVAVAPYGEYWRQMKSIFVLQLLSNRRVQSFQAIREEETALMVKRIQEACSLSLTVNLSEMFVSFTNDVVCRAAFGKKYSEGEGGKRFMQLMRIFLELLGTISVGNFIPWLKWIDQVNGFDAKVDRVAKEIDGFLEEVIKERENLVGHESSEMFENKEGEKDFLDILLKIHKHDTIGISMDRDSVKALILDTFAAGTDTTSTVLEWSMSELIRHPQIMKKLQHEVRVILKGKTLITEEDLEKMQYLKSVLKETLRFHPPIPLLVPRKTRQDVKVMGYDIAAGTMVMTNAWAIGRDPLLWNEPEEFMPERFLDSTIDYKGHDFQLIPFGAGRRACPGIAFGMAINELVLANLVHKFNWELPNGSRGQDLDMTESPGSTIHRRVPLLAVPICDKNA
uniref:Cytochrome P450 monooxygenase n=1 Tax=Nothapodytes nimmoniana TaxID=159386 RepID=A0A0N6W1G4_NOTNI|nr:cytochrome P450 monooxygenase [Nothapodytes nimmoniana]